jgi:glutamyl-tRNA reductase
VHKAGDLKDAIDEKVSETLTKLDAADEKYSDIARDVIENLPFLTSLALEQGAKELLMKIDLSLDRMTTAIENGAEKSKQFTIDQYKKAVEKLREQRERIITAILELYDKVIAKRMRIWKRTSPIYNARADSRIKELKDYLATKHPANPKYQS